MSSMSEILLIAVGKDDKTRDTKELLLDLFKQSL